MSENILFGLKFEPVTLSGAVTQIAEAAGRKTKGVVVTPNVDHVVMTTRDDEMLHIYQSALFRYADGMPIVWLSRVVDARPLPERVTGADLLPAVCQVAAQTGLKLYFLGGNPGVAELAAATLRKEHPGLIVTGVYSPPFGFESDKVESARIVDEINAKKADILFVGVGAPKQEKWAYAHLDRLDVGPILCVGAAFDFAAGVVRRAPVIVQKTGLEWLWRLASEPRRLWKRYLFRDSRFLLMALHEIFAAVRR